MIKFLKFLCFIILLCIERTLLQNPSSCGVRQNRQTALIVGGNVTEQGAWPWHVAVHHTRRGTTYYACGGTLISELFVLTAGHCVVDGDDSNQLSKNRIYVQLGVYNLDQLNTKTTQQHSVEKIHQHKSFTNENLRNDIALLELATTAQFNDYVQPACVSLTKDLTGQFGTAIGWGVTDDDEISPILKSAQMPVIDPVKCSKSNPKLFGTTLDESIFCAGYTNGTSVCNGDSGGGIFFNKSNVWYVGGIVSFTDNRNEYSNLCNTRGYAAFTKVYNFLQWISSITKQLFIIEEETLQTNEPRQCVPRDADTSPKDTNLLPRNCGRYISNRIKRGQNARVFEFPWMAMFLYMDMEKSSKVEYENAGTLINSRYVLTSAKSVVPLPFVSNALNFVLWKVRLGEHTKGQDIDCNDFDGERECAPPARDYGFECIIKHQNYSRQMSSNDIALVRLEEDVFFEKHIQPICLPVTPELRKLRLPQYIISGWNAPILRKATIPAAKSSECQEWMKYQWSDSQLCIGKKNGENACTGGVPLGYLAKLNGMRFVQFGISSFDNNCDEFPAVYTNISFFMDWVLANIRF